MCHRARVPAQMRSVVNKITKATYLILFDMMKITSNDEGQEIAINGKIRRGKKIQNSKKNKNKIK